MQTKEARQLANILRLVADRLEADPRSLLDFLGQQPTQAAPRAVPSTPPAPASAGPFKPLTLFHNSDKDQAALRTFLGTFTKADLTAHWAAHPYSERVKFPKSLTKGKIIDQITSFVASTDLRDQIIEIL
jgi:hypothetical protein